MSQLQSFTKENLRKSASFALAFAFLCSASALAEPITGVVTNKTNAKPAAGDDVVLLKLSQGMQELARTKTDSKGHFSIEVPQDGLHMIRVTHDKANYFRPVQPGTQSVEVEVFSAAAKVDGVTQEADVMRIQSEPGGSGLRVVEHYFIKNDSSPQKTQFSDHPFELWLPAGAIVEGSAAMAPGGMAVQQPLVPMAEPNHYTMIFPLRPGETQFQVTYKLPYSGTLTFAPKPALPTDTVAVMLPKSITFRAGASSPYTPVTEETTAQTFVARNVKPSQPLDFTISGTGELPRDSQAGPQQAGPQQGAQPGAAAGPGGDPQSPAEASAQMRADTQPGKGLGNPLDSDGTLDPWHKYKWAIVIGLAVVLAIGAAFLLRNPGAPSHASSSPQPKGLPPVAPTSPMQVLKDELFAIETERIQGRLTEAEYAEQKAALETVLKRTLARNGQV